MPYTLAFCSLKLGEYNSYLSSLEKNSDRKITLAQLNLFVLTRPFGKLTEIDEKFRNNHSHSKNEASWRTIWLDIQSGSTLCI